MDVQGIKDIVYVGDITAPDGASGAVRFKPSIKAFDRLSHDGVLLGTDGCFHWLDSVNKNGPNFRLVFKGVHENAQAKMLTGMKLFVHRDAFPDSDEDGVYYQDLIGLKAVNEQGESFGIVVDVQNFGAGELVEIEGAHGLAYLPFTLDHVPEVDLEAGLLVIRDYAPFFECALAVEPQTSESENTEQEKQGQEYD